MTSAIERCQWSARSKTEIPVILEAICTALKGFYWRGAEENLTVVGKEQPKVAYLDCVRETHLETGRFEHFELNALIQELL